MADDLDNMTEAEIDKLYQQSIKTTQSAPADDLDNMTEDQINAEFEKINQPSGYTAAQALTDVSTGARSLLKGFSGGLTEPIFAGTNAFQQSGFNADEFEKAYQADLQRQSQNTAPVAGMVNEIAGALSPGSLPGRIAKGVQVITPVAEGASLIKKALQLGGQSVLAGGAEQALRSSAEQLGQFDPQQMVSDVAGTSLASGAIGASIPFVGKAISKIPDIAKKSLSSLGGVQPETINKYIKNYDEIAAAPTKEGAIQKVDDFVQGLKTEALSSKEKLVQAKDALKAAEVEAKYILQEKGFDLRDKISQARVQLDKEFHEALGPIKEKANLQGLADDIDKSIGELKQKVIEGSKQSYALLDNAANEGVQINRGEILGTIDGEMNKLKTGGVVIGQSNKAAYAKLNQLKEDIASVSNQAKKELVDAVDGQISTMEQAIRSSEAGKRSILYTPNAPGGQVIAQGSSFPTWFSENGFRTKEEFLGAVRRKKGPMYEKIKKMAEDRVLGGFDDGIHGRGEPDQRILKSMQEEQYLEPSQAKKIIQSLDKDIEDAYNNNQFSSAFDGAAAQTRRAIDSQLKKYVPGYEDAMAFVAKDAETLGKANKVFKDKDAIRRELGQVTKSTKGERLKLLEDLGNSTGYAFKDRVGGAKRAEETISNPEALSGIKSLLPAQNKVKSLESGLKSISTGRARDNFINRETKALSSKAEEAQKAYEALNNDLSKVSQLASQNGSRRSIETFLSSSKDNNLELFKRLSELSGEDFVGTLQNIATREAFNKSAQIGSRNVNLFTALATGAGLATGGLSGGAVGIPVGAAVGAAVDKFGPKMTQKLLDAVVKIGKNPSVQKINNLNLNPEMKDYLLRQLNVATRQAALKD